MRALELVAERPEVAARPTRSSGISAAETDGKFPELVGTGDKMAVVRRMVEKVAASDTTVFLAGESGTGKELVARAIHRRRRARPGLRRHQLRARSPSRCSRASCSVT